MSPRVLILPLLAALAACQSPNPYTSQSLPVPPAPAQAAASGGFDPSSYPSAPLDYGRYRSWGWAGVGGSPAAYGTPLEEAVSQQLDQQGLRPARPGVAPDLRVSARLNSEQRTRQVTDYYDAGYYGGDPWRRPGYGYGASVPVTRTYVVQVNVVRVDLFDARSNQSVFSGAAEYEPGGNASAQAQGLREALRKALAGYPPH
ncbi:MAG: hypothetical protein GAK43_02265 [Stenotrophomonas maltophilia]|nr:MAG: hypothetical protein GAK43_02265 [Stenotrophomonas maltophilia]